MTHASLPLLASALCLSTLCVAQASAQSTMHSLPAADPARDRAAILAMQGEYKVSFAFDETVLLADGYQRMQPQRSGASEVVIVVEDSPRKIVLQHLLLEPGSGHVTKHWRQDWTYEAPTCFEFSADQTWTVRGIPAEKTRGAWTQCVYEVSDAPRYCGTGKWNHKYGVATWTSDRSWRPLPRREYTKRSDYNALNVENRHTIVPGGWTHEQDNTKTVRTADGSTIRTIAREFGFNDYRKTTEVDFKAAYDYWNATKDYWARVRAGWDEALAAHQGLRLKTAVDGMPIIEATFTQADRVAKGETVSDDDLRAVFTAWVGPPPEPVASQVSR
jgi:hypothetical protein